MINLRHVPVVKVLIPYALGSLAGYTGFIGTNPLSIVLILFPLWAGSLLFYILPVPGNRTFQLCFILAVKSLFFLAGLATGTIDKPEDPGIPAGEYAVVKGKVRDEPVIRNGKLVFGLELEMAYSNDSIFLNGTLLKTYLQVPSTTALPGVGEMWVFCGTLIPVKNAGNPGEVDYASVLRRRNCWYRFYCDTTDCLNRRLDESAGKIPGPGEIRKDLSEYWEGSPESVSLLKAVCLGDRSGLSEDLQQSYSMSGGMHVLAVSGLHVGLIWWVLNRVFWFMVRLGKREIYRAVLISLILWGYAYVTGFSSSVSRSVTMFTFYSLSRIIHHRGHPVNAILVSMFMLILIHPGRLLEVGFQLSYTAILSIVTLNPVIAGIWRPGNSLTRWCWEATGVSLAAQMGTLPLVIFYFHQVPIYALLTNLIVIPLLSCIITIFVVAAPLAGIGVGTGIANALLIMAASAMNAFVELIASFPYSVVAGLFTDRVTTFMLMILLFLLIIWFIRREREFLYISAFVFFIMVVWLSGRRADHLQSNVVQISNFKGGSLITIKEGRMVDHYILSDDPQSVVFMDRYLSEAWGRRCFEVSVLRLSEGISDYPALGGGSGAVQIKTGLWLVGNNRIRGVVLAGRPGEGAIEFLSEVNPDFLLISGDPVLSQEDILSISRNIVVDGSSPVWYTGKLRQTGLSFYNTASRGAFVTEY
jgi:competence protein ComEC